MAGVALAAWHFNPYLAALAGLAGYGISLAVLRPFTAEEETILAGIMPTSLRRRLGIKA
jgi:hypothetical protein